MQQVRAHMLQNSDFQCAMHCLSLLAAILQLLRAASNHSMHPADMHMGYSQETVPSDLMTRTALIAILSVFSNRSLDMRTDVSALLALN